MAELNKRGKIIAVTETRPEGQKCTGVWVEYGCALKAEALRKELFAVQGRTIESAAAYRDMEGMPEDGNYVYLGLSAEDPGAATYFPGDPWNGVGARIEEPHILVSQIQGVRGAQGEEIPAWGPEKSKETSSPLADEFVQGNFEGLAYNLFIPRSYDPAKKYPLVQFIHDAAVCGRNPKLTLAQGVGALVWMTKEAQEEHPCFVLAPQYDVPSIVDDDWNVDPRLETGKRLLDWIVSEYPVDRDRLYTTGQSMGCMASMVLNLRYPDLFAASFFVAGQWDENLFSGSGLQDSKFWFLNSQGDAKAFPGMNQILVKLEKDGAKIAREVWRTGETQEFYMERTKRLLETGANMIYTPYEITAVADGWHSDGGEHHIHTWRHAYQVRAIHEWLFAQKR